MADVETIEQLRRQVRDLVAQLSRDRAELSDRIEEERLRTGELVERLALEQDTLRTIMENTPAHLAYLDRQFNFILVNSTYAAGAGLSKEELIGRNHFELFPDAENQAIFEQVRDTGQPVTFAAKPYKHPGRSGEITYWDWTLTPVKDQAGQVQGLVFSLLDVTGRKREELAQRLLAEVGQLLAGSLDYKVTLQELARLIVSRMADHCVIYLVEEGQVAEANADPAREAAMRKPGWRPQAADSAGSLIGQALQTGQAIVKPELDEQLLAGSRPGSPARSALVAPLLASGRIMGAIGLLYTGSGRIYNEADLPLAEALGRRVGLALDNMRLYETEQQARVMAEAAQQRLAFLAAASSTLAVSLDYEVTLQNLARLVVRFLAEDCAVDIIDEDGSLRRVAVAAADPAREALLRALQQLYPPEREPSSRLLQVLASGQPALLPDISPLDIVRPAPHDAGYRDLVKRINTHAAIIVPLQAHRRTLGAMTLGRTVPGGYNGADLSLAEELARRAALALENARLYRQTEAELLARRQAEERLTVLLQEKEGLLREKEVLLKEVYHRVKNNLQGVSNLIYLQAGYIKDERVRAMLQQTQDRLRSLALIHEKLYQSQDLARVDFAEYANSLARHLVYSYQADPNLIRLKTRIDDVILDADTLIPIGIIVNELVSNALKYAFPNGRSGEIVIELLKEAGNRLVLSVSDDGVGLPEQFDLANADSLGLQLVQTLAGSIRGAVELDRSRGARVTVRFEHPAE